MKNVERVGDTNIVGLHTANHNERGNPHPQYVRRNVSGLLTGISLLGGWNTNGGGSIEGGYRMDGDFLDVWFKYVMGSASQSASYFGINVPVSLSGPGIGTHVGTGVLNSATGASRTPLSIISAGGSGFRVYKATSPMTEVTSGTDYLEGRDISGLIRVRT